MGKKLTMASITAAAVISMTGCGDAKMTTNTGAGTPSTVLSDGVSCSVAPGEVPSSVNGIQLNTNPGDPDSSVIAVNSTVGELRKNMNFLVSSNPDFKGLSDADRMGAVVFSTEEFGKRLNGVIYVPENGGDCNLTDPELQKQLRVAMEDDNDYFAEVTMSANVINLGNAINVSLENASMEAGAEELRSIGVFKEIDGEFVQVDSINLEAEFPPYEENVTNTLTFEFRPDSVGVYTLGLPGQNIGNGSFGGVITVNEDTTNEDTTNEDTTNEDTTNEDTTNEDTTNEDTTNEDTTNEDTTNEDTTNEDITDIQENESLNFKEAFSVISSIKDQYFSYGDNPSDIIFPAMNVANITGDGGYEIKYFANEIDVTESVVKGKKVSINVGNNAFKATVVETKGDKEKGSLLHTFAVTEKEAPTVSSVNAIKNFTDFNITTLEVPGNSGDANLSVPANWSQLKVVLSTGETSDVFFEISKEGNTSNIVPGKNYKISKGEYVITPYYMDPKNKKVLLSYEKNIEVVNNEFAYVSDSVFSKSKGGVVTLALQPSELSEELSAFVDSEGQLHPDTNVTAVLGDKEYPLNPNAPSFSSETFYNGPLTLNYTCGDKAVSVTTEQDILVIPEGAASINSLGSVTEGRSFSVKGGLDATKFPEGTQFSLEIGDNTQDIEVDGNTYAERLVAPTVNGTTDTGVYLVATLPAGESFPIASDTIRVNNYVAPVVTPPPVVNPPIDEGGFE